jgi:hypothetical protein
LGTFLRKLVRSWDTGRTAINQHIVMLLMTVAGLQSAFKTPSSGAYNLLMMLSGDQGRSHARVRPPTFVCPGNGKTTLAKWILEDMIPGSEVVTHESDMVMTTSGDIRGAATLRDDPQPLNSIGFGDYIYDSRRLFEAMRDPSQLVPKGINTMKAAAVTESRLKSKRSGQQTLIGINGTRTNQWLTQAIESTRLTQLWVTLNAAGEALGPVMRRRTIGVATANSVRSDRTLATARTQDPPTREFRGKDAKNTAARIRAPYVLIQSVWAQASTGAWAAPCCPH